MSVLRDRVPKSNDTNKTTVQILLASNGASQSVVFEYDA